MTQFYEITRIEWDKSTWIVFWKKGADWQNLKVVLLNGRRVKANYLMAWSKFRQEFADNHDRATMIEHAPGLFNSLTLLACGKFPPVAKPQEGTGSEAGEEGTKSR